MLTAKEQKLLDMLEKRAADTDVEIVTIEIVGAKRSPLVRIYIDTPTGVSFDELSSAQAWIGDLFDELDPFPGAYTLEVSSPGIDRPLRTPEHFARFQGEKVSVKTTQPLDGRSNFKGIIESADGNAVVLNVDGDTFTIPFDSIKKANLIGEIQF